VDVLKGEGLPTTPEFVQHLERSHAGGGYVTINGHRWEAATVLDWHHDRETPETMLLDDFLLGEMRRQAGYRKGDSVPFIIGIRTKP
jgi:hypothetical protein